MTIKFLIAWAGYAAGQVVDYPDDGVADAWCRRGVAVRVATAPRGERKTRGRE